MLRLVSLQLMLTAAVGLLAGLLGGVAAMVSAVIGGLCCVVPNGIVALRLYAGAQKPGGPNAGSFFIWEFVKIAMTVACMFAAVKLYHDLNWLAFLGGFIVALKGYIILLFRH